MRSELLLAMADFGNSKQALAIGYARMLPAIRQVVRSWIYRISLGDRAAFH